MVRHAVIAGASGLIGRALVASLRSDGVRVTTLVRRTALDSSETEWMTAASTFNSSVLADADVVICLNGATIGRLPWTTSYRRTLRDSRITPTRILATALLELGPDAPAFLSASAVGIYGSQPGSALNETSPTGDTFLADLCVDWEREALTAATHSRVVLLRTAPLLHRDAVLKPLILLTRFGVSGPLGSGTQMWPWITLDDEVRAIRHLIDSDVSGPVNLTGPVPATANEIGRELARAMRRPFWFRAPAWALRAVLGRAAADSLLLPDAEVSPAVLLANGFEFRHKTAAEAIASVIGK